MISINKMTIRHEDLEVSNLLLSKFRDEESKGNQRFIIFAINQSGNKLIGANIINLDDVKRTKNMTLTLGKYDALEIMKAPEDFENITDEDSEDFDENITFTLSYFLTQGFDFPKEWDKVSFGTTCSRRRCGDNCGDCSVPP